MYLQGEWIKTNFGPTMRQRYPEIKIIGVDDRLFTVPLWFNMVSILETPRISRPVYRSICTVHDAFELTLNTHLMHVVSL